MIDLFKRLTRIDLRNLTPTQIVIGIIGIVVALAIINFVLNIAQTLLPIAALGLVGYLAYQWLSSRDDDKNVAQAMQAQQKQAQQKQAKVVQTKSADPASDDADMASADTTSDDADMAVASERLRVEQVINPDTGFKEADLSRLEAEEKARLADKKAEEAAVQQQLEERRRRLLGGDDN